MKPAKHSRRAFLGRTAAGLSAASLPASLPAQASSAQGARQAAGANDRINVALIGVGNIGTRHLTRRLLPLANQEGTIRVVAASDIYERAKKRAREMAGLSANDVHHDYRDMLARPDVDAVVIATPDHWHARMALDAMNAGKDVYLEKPMSYTIAEAKEIAATVTRTGRVLQIGSQWVSDPRYHHAKEVLEKGWIGQPLWAQSSYSSNYTRGVWQYYVDEEATPETVDWDAFLGSAPKQPFSAERFFRWRKYWDFSGGVATDFFYHRLSPLLLVLGPRFPTRVSAHGGVYVFKNREVPDTYSTTVEYEKMLINISSSSGSAAGNRLHGPAIYGHEGAIEIVDGAVVVTPEKLYLEKFRSATGKDRVRIEVPSSDLQEVRLNHMKNFLDSVRSRKQPLFDAFFGYQVMVAIKLGVDSYREGKMMAFDPATEQVIEPPPPRGGYEGDGKNYEDQGYRKRPA